MEECIEKVLDMRGALIAEIFDTREDGLKCVRFESGQVGVVDERGEVVYQIDKCRHIEFAEHDFVKLRTTKE